MFKNWKTSVAGVLTGIALAAPVLSNVGIHLGHYGATDFIQLFGALAATTLGLAAKDSNVTGGTVKQ